MKHEIKIYPIEVAGIEVDLVEFKLEGNIVPEEAKQLTEKAEMDFSKYIAISGRGPIWLYGMLIHKAHPAKAVFVNDPRVGFVCVMSHVKEFEEGDVLKPEE